MTADRADELLRIIRDDGASAAEHVAAVGELVDIVCPPPEPGEPTLREQLAAARAQLDAITARLDARSVPAIRSE